MRPSPREKHFGCLSPQGEFPKCPEDNRVRRKEFSPGALLWVTFVGHARKVTKALCPKKNTVNDQSAAENKVLTRSVLRRPTIGSRGKFQIPAECTGVSFFICFILFQYNDTVNPNKKAGIYPNLLSDTAINFTCYFTVSMKACRTLNNRRSQSSTGRRRECCRELTNIALRPMISGHAEHGRAPRCPKKHYTDLTER